MVANTFKEGVTYPFRDGNVVVLGPGVFAKEGGDVISWEGKNYYPYDETEVELPHYPRPAVNGGSLIGPGVLINQAGNLIHYNGETFVPEPTSKEILARRDMQQRRLDMLRIALDVKEISPTDHRTVTQVADDLLKWWLKEEEK